MDYKFLNCSDIEDQNLLLESMKKNITTMKLLKSEINRLKNVATNVEKGDYITDKEQDTIEKSSAQKVDLDFQEETIYYLSELENIMKGEVSKEKLEEVLPSKQHISYKRLILRIKAELLKQMIEVKKFIEEEDLTVDELQEFRMEILDYQNMIDLITEIEQEKKEQEEEFEENRLFFLPTPTENIYVLEEIDSISPEFYDRFIELFQSIQNSTFKNVKSFSNNKKYQGISEVRGYQVRVIFDRIGSKEYMILSAIVKKSDNEKIYRESLATRTLYYQNVQAELIEKLHDEQFLAQNQELTEALYKKLRGNETKNKLKTLGGGVTYATR